MAKWGKVLNRVFRWEKNSVSSWTTEDSTVLQDERWKCEMAFYSF